MTNNTAAELLFARILKGNEEAVTFLIQLCRVLHFWDDLEDRDKSIPRSEVDSAMYIALVALPRNQFYRRYFDELNPLVTNAIFNWHCANQLEADDDEAAKQIAFVIRSAYADVALTAARIVGGYEWARQVAPEIRRHWHKEGFGGYLANLEKQRQSAKELSHVLR
jgi:hypothetical protein